MDEQDIDHGCCGHMWSFSVSAVAVVAVHTVSIGPRTGDGRAHRDEEVLCHLRADSGHGLGGVGGWPKDLEVLTGAEREHLGISGEQGRIPPTIPNQPRITQGL